MDRAVADRDTARIFAHEAIESRAYNKGFLEDWKIDIDKHEWIKALQMAEVDSASPLYQSYTMPFEAYDVEKTDDEEEAANLERPKWRCFSHL